ncbi:S41 family peptidase [Lentzea sp. BCCO 10_0856]|uniref:S41 family peptidase n=1 Tax=Lentzea miocenica TaxID=3095431 RepID=A0ABU4TBK6_9PSEU|nr:S41 family peptidase [Lentzea sp. BCCO 10_0856]MDX8035553.1 S41 family peptidase [Lentzea sp. BCCO 10_0856]
MREPEIELLCSQLASYYVFPDTANEIATVLRTRLAEGAYVDAVDDEEFAARVTADLQSVNGDKHLRLLHSVEEVPETGQEPAWDPVAYRKEAELDAFGVRKIERLKGNVGLLEFNLLHDAEIATPAVIAAMNLIAHTDALIIDLRANGGGDPNTVALICSYLFDEEVHLNDIYNRPDDTTRQFWTLPHVPGPKFGGKKPIYVLTSARTFSGAEELSYNLQQSERATLIGETTKGGAHPGERYRVGPHLKSAVPNGRAINPVSGTNWEGVGVVPHVEVPADKAFEIAYEKALEHVLTLGDDGPRRLIAAAAAEALKG